MVYQPDNAYKKKYGHQFGQYVTNPDNHLAGENVFTQYSYTKKEKNKFSQRIMNNQLLILKNETYLDNVCNAIEGSYYVSELIQVIAEKSLLLFKKIEKKGGYIESFNSGYISNQIKNNSDSEKLLYKLNKKVLVGFNKYNEGLEFSSNKELLKSKKIIKSLKHNIDRIAKSELN